MYCSKGETASSCVLRTAGSVPEQLGIGFHTETPMRTRVLARALRTVILQLFVLLAGRIVLISQFPQTTGGKLDQRRLAEDVLQHDNDGDRHSNKISAECERCSRADLVSHIGDRIAGSPYTSLYSCGDGTTLALFQ